MEVDTKTDAVAGLDECETVKLVCGDKSFLVPRTCIKVSRVLSLAADEAGPSECRDGVLTVPVSTHVKPEVFEYIVEFMKRRTTGTDLPGPYNKPLPDARKPETFLGPTATDDDKAEVRRLVSLFTAPDATKNHFLYSLVLAANALDMQGLMNAGAAVTAGFIKGAKPQELNRMLEPSTRADYFREKVAASIEEAPPAAKKANTALD